MTTQEVHFDTSVRTRGELILKVTRAIARGEHERGVEETTPEFKDTLPGCFEVEEPTHQN